MVTSHKRRNQDFPGRRRREETRITSWKRNSLILAMKAQMGNILERVKAYVGGRPESK